MTRTVKIVIIVVLVVAAIAAVASIVGLAVAHGNGIGVGPRHMLGTDGYRIPGPMGSFNQRVTTGWGGWGVFLVLPWVSLALVVGLAVALLLWRPLRPAAAGAAAVDPTAHAADIGTQWEQWHHSLHAREAAHEAVTQAQPAASQAVAATAVEAEPAAPEVEAPAEAESPEAEAPAQAQTEAVAPEAEAPAEAEPKKTPEAPNEAAGSDADETPAGG